MLVNALPYKGCSLATQLWPRLKEAWSEVMDISHFLKKGDTSHCLFHMLTGLGMTSLGSLLGPVLQQEHQFLLPSGNVNSESIMCTDEPITEGSGTT